LNSSTNQDSEAVEHILVIRFSSLGDILLTAPALRSLRKRFPSAHIDLLVADEFRDAAELIPGPNRVLGFNRRGGFTELLTLRRKLSRCYHVVVDLQNNFRSSFLRTFLFPTLWVKARRYRIRRWLLIHFKWDLYGDIRPVPIRYIDAVEMLGCEQDGRGLELKCGDETDSSLKPFVVLCPGAKHFTKRWPEERWIELGNLLSSSGKQVTVLGAQSEHELVSRTRKGIPGAVEFIGKPIQEVGTLLKKAEFAVTNDSGIMHLAAGVGTPLISIFGSTVQQFGFGPFTDKAIIVEQELSCRPCTAFGRSSCPKQHFRCMMDATAEAVFTKTEELNLIQR